MTDRDIADAARHYVTIRDRHHHPDSGPLLSQVRAAHQHLIDTVRAEHAADVLEQDDLFGGAA